MSTLALNMIVGPGDAASLQRCLESHQAKERFDEIVLVLTSLDEATKTVAADYTDKIFHFDWKTDDHPHGDFAGARNVALKNTKSDYMMWLDCDDVLLPEYSSAFEDLVAIVKKPENAVVDYYAYLYALTGDERGTTGTFMKERIFKIYPESQWTGAVHEQFNIDRTTQKQAIVNNIETTHCPDKPATSSADRNVKILWDEYYRKGNKAVINKYFLGRDLMLIGRAEEGVPLLEEMITEYSTHPENMYNATFDLILYYSYGGINMKPTLEAIPADRLEKVEGLCRVALSFSVAHAEPYAILGDIYFRRGEVAAAEKMYITALKKKTGSGSIQLVPYYEEVPADRLANIHIMQGENEKALWYSKRAWLHNRTNDNYRMRINNLNTAIGKFYAEAFNG